MYTSWSPTSNLYPPASSMADSLPHLSTDQVAAFVELGAPGQIRRRTAFWGSPSRACGAGSSRSRRSSASSLPQEPRAAALERAHRPGPPLSPSRAGVSGAAELLSRVRHRNRAAGDPGRGEPVPDSLRADRRAKRFRKQAPDIHVRVSTMTEREVEEALLTGSRSRLRAGGALRAVARSRVLTSCSR